MPQAVKGGGTRRDEKDLDERWYTWCLSEWVDMPDFEMHDLRPVKQIIINFQSWEDYKQFCEHIGLKGATQETPSTWWPIREKLKTVGIYRWISRQPRRQPDSANVNVVPPENGSIPSG